MKALFVELPAFDRHRAEYLNDEGFQALQTLLMANPEKRRTLKALIKAELDARRSP